MARGVRKPKKVTGKTKQGTDTVRVTLKSIMLRREFRMGYEDGYNMRPFSANYDDWSVSDQWTYERGRLFGARIRAYVEVAARNAGYNGPKEMPELKDGKRLSYRMLYQYAVEVHAGMDPHHRVAA